MTRPQYSVWHPCSPTQVTFVHAAPGFVKTAWGTELPGWMRAGVRFVQLFAKSPEDCAENMCDGLFNPALRGGFRLLSPTATPGAGLGACLVLSYLRWFIYFIYCDWCC